MFSVLLDQRDYSNLSYVDQCLCEGLEVTFSGNPGHGSVFIQNNAAEKMVSLLLEFGGYFQRTMLLLCSFELFIMNM